MFVIHADEADSYSPTTSSVYNNLTTISMNQQELAFFRPQVRSNSAADLLNQISSKQDNVKPLPLTMMLCLPFSSPLSKPGCLLVVNYWHSHRVSPHQVCISSTSLRHPVNNLLQKAIFVCLESPVTVGPCDFRGTFSSATALLCFSLLDRPPMWTSLLIKTLNGV
jgi:hypothetical protein